MENKNLSDSKLLEQYFSGNQRGIEELILKYKDKVYTYILLNVKKVELAEDLFQETFIKVVGSVKNGKYQDNGKFLSWVLRIAHNLIVDHYRKNQNNKPVNLDDFDTNIQDSIITSKASVDYNVSYNNINKELKELVYKLPDEQREVLLLRYFIGMSFKEISEYTNVSINTALGRMRYAVLNLRKQISDKNLVLQIQE